MPTVHEDFESKEPQGSELQLENSEPSETCSDVVFRLLLTCYGVHTGSSPRKWRRIASLLFLISILLLFPLTEPLHLYTKIIASRSSHLSLADLTVILGSIVYIVFLPYLLCLLIFRHGDIEPLLRNNGRMFTEVFSFLLLAVPVLAWAVPHGGLLSVFVSCNVLAQFVAVAVWFMLYVDMACNLERNHCRIRDAFKDRTLIWDQLISAKWDTRDRVSKINSLSAYPLAALYSNMFLMSVYVTAEAILQDVNAPMTIAALVNLPCFGLQLFLVAREASRVRSSCEETEREFLRRLSKSSTRDYIDPATMECFRFHSEWDSLRVGCFSHSMCNFWKFISVVTTCTAVVLQFDFRVVRTIGELSASVPSSR